MIQKENSAVAIRWAHVLGGVAMLLVLPSAPLPGDEPLPKGFYSLTGVKVTPAGAKPGKADEAVRLTQRIAFDIQTRYAIIKGTEDKPFKILNPTVESKSSLTLDKPIKFKGENVPAGTNLLKYKKFDGAFFNVSSSSLFPLAVGSANIMKDFEFAADTYTVKFEWTTEQGEVLSDTVKVFIEVDLSAKP